MKFELCVSNRKEWRSWLKKNHAKAKGIWLVYFKKDTGKRSINYTDSVEEALCFGWIDGLKKSIDEQKYARAIDAGVHVFTYLGRLRTRLIARDSRNWLRLKSLAISAFAEISLSMAVSPISAQMLEGLRSGDEDATGHAPFAASMIVFG